MSDTKHPWVVDYREFEAVLLCVNERGEFKPDADLRAFQIYGWDDATTPGNDRTYAHAKTGVMVRYEGNVAAIEYSGERLTEALEDLFRALAGLGWLLADVYHPAITMNALLTDMGRAIPPGCDLDLRAARDLDELSDTPEGSDIVARGMALLGVSDENAFHRDVLAEFAELEPEDSATVALAPAATPTSGPLFLADDEGATGDGNIDVHPEVAPHAGMDWQVDLDETPRHFVPGAHRPLTPDIEAPARATRAPSMPANEPPITEARTDDSRGSARDVQQVIPPRPVVSAAATPKAGPASEAPVAVGTRSEQVSSGLQFYVARVGVSAIMFDRPGTGLTAEDIERLSDEMNAAEVVHLYPGMLDAEVRWDVFGELDAERPMLAEKLAALLSGVDQGNGLLAAKLVQLSTRESPAGLRGLVEMVSAPEYVEEGQKGLVWQASVQALQGFIAMHGAVALSPAGKAFVDVAGTPGPFSVRNVIHSRRPSVYVVHVDSLDGPVVLNWVSVIEELAKCYAATHQFSEVVRAGREVTEAEKQRASMLQKASAQLATTLRDLKDLGIPMPAA